MSDSGSTGGGDGVVERLVGYRNSMIERLTRALPTISSYEEESAFIDAVLDLAGDSALGLGQSETGRLLNFRSWRLMRAQVGSDQAQRIRGLRWVSLSSAVTQPAPELEFSRAEQLEVAVERILAVLPDQAIRITS